MLRFLRKILKRILSKLRKTWFGQSLCKQKSQSSSQFIPQSPPEIILDHQLLCAKNVLITGAGRNIGRAIALEMARQGANIFFTDIDPEACAQLEQDLRSLPVVSQGYVSDAASVEDVDALCQGLQNAGITIDILVNNVGIQFEQGLRQSTLTQWQATLNTNVIGPMYLSQQIVEAMIQQRVRGSILFITSIHQFTISRSPSYGASKAALGMVIAELAVDLAAHGIRVNGIAPGWVAVDDQGKPRYHPYTPLGRQSIHPAYIGRAAVYLAADYFSQGTTGTVLKIDGGLSLYNSRVVECPPGEMS